MFRDGALAQLIRDLDETLAAWQREHGSGRAIAAPQIGVAQRVIVARTDGPPVLVNPVITRRSRTRMVLWDDCFSFPTLLVKVRRSLSVDVRYQDEEGRLHHLQARGALAELLQHEIDHLDGVLAIDRAIDSRHIIYREEHERLRDRSSLVM
jgi:peptide deformylase